jgi:nitrogenase-stabilizing/protective protein
MTTWLDQLQQLSAAEDFFETLDVSYDPAVLRVVRLHVLQRFNTYIQQAEGLAAMDETSGKALCATLLARAYEDFLTSTPVQEKVFKVFKDQDAPRPDFVPIGKIRSRQPS